MYIKELSLMEFIEYSKDNIIVNYYQSINYAMLKDE